MSSHAATVSEIYAAFSRGDVPAILSRVAPDALWESWPDHWGQNAGVPWLQARRGRGEVAGFFESLQALQFTEFTVRSLLTGGNQVAADVVVGVTVKATGRAFRDEELHLWTFNAAGQVCGFRHYADTAKHIAAAGK